MLAKYFGTYRFVYNQCLEFKQSNKCSMTDLNRHIINLKKSTCLWLKETNSKTHQQAIINLLTSYNNFFKNKNHFGLPKFKSKHHKQSCRFPIDAISSSCFINTKFSLVTGLKDIVFKCSDRDRDDLILNRDKVKSVTVIKTKTGKYFASVLIDINNHKKKCGNGIVGIDLGVKTYMTLSNGNKIEQPKWTYKNEKKQVNCY